MDRKPLNHENKPVQRPKIDRRTRRSRTVAGLKAEALEPRSLLSTIYGPKLDEGRANLLEPAQPAAPAAADLGALADLYSRQILGQQAPVHPSGLGATDPSTYLSFDAAGRVGVQIRSTQLDALAPALAAAGFQAIGRAPEDPIVEGYIPVANLPSLQLIADQGAAFIRPMYQPLSNSTPNQADLVQEAARVRNTPTVGRTGAGTAVLVISDSFDVLDGYADDIASGDLPAGVVVVDESAGTVDQVKDEGRAMAQLIYDLAPGAKLFFHSVDSQTVLADYLDSTDGDGFAVDAAAMGITRLVAVDDINFLDAPFFQNSLVGKAVNKAATDAGHAKVSYFSSAGNHDTDSYERSGDEIFTVVGRRLDFDPGAGSDGFQSVTLPAGGSTTIVLQWNEPFGESQTDLDIFVSIGGVRTGLPSATTNNFDGDPLEILGITNFGGVPVTFDLEIVRTFATGASPEDGPEFVKYIAFGQSLVINEYATNSPTIVGHNAAENAMAVAAAPFFNHSTPEGFTSHGPTVFRFNDAGAAIAPVTRQTPGITGTDGTSTTVPGFANFFGTSAAAPNVAAVAALMLEGAALTPTQVFTQLKATATDIHTPGDDRVTGAGMVDAYNANYFVTGDPTFPVAGQAVKRASVATTLADSFESGALSLNWQTNSNGGGRIQARTLGDATDGTKALVLDSFGVGSVPLSLNEATLHLDATTLPNGVPFILSFRQRESTGGDFDDPMPATFAGSVNADGVAISVDGGLNWHRLVSLTGADSGPAWRSHTFDIKAFATANSLTLGNDVRIKFQQFDLFGLENDGMVFDQLALSTVVSSLTQADIKLNPNETQAPAQRSRVTEIALDVKGTVSASPLPALSLRRLQDNASIPLVAKSIAPTPGDPTKTRLLLGFNGPLSEYGSVPDGDYEFIVDGLTDANGLALDTDADQNPGGPPLSLSFHRFFGDSDGDRDVDAVDIARFRLSNLSIVPFLAYFDYNNSGPTPMANSRHDGLDLAAFRLRLGKKLAPPIPS